VEISPLVTSIAGRRHLQRQPPAIAVSGTFAFDKPLYFLWIQTSTYQSHKQIDEEIAFRRGQHFKRRQHFRHPSVQFVRHQVNAGMATISQVNGTAIALLSLFFLIFQLR
jgi:hypothetical protein